ncbi:MAG: hypothetical protein ACLQEQ_00950 [Nitrososphaerales archaeon]
MKKTKTLRKITTSVLLSALLLSLSLVGVASASTPSTSAQLNTTNDIFMMNNPTTISSIAPVPTSSSSTLDNLKPISLEGFENTTVVFNQHVFLLLSQGSTGGSSYVLYHYWKSSREGNTSIEGAMTGGYNVLTAIFTPKSGNLNLTDTFDLNYTSSFQGQLMGVMNGLTQTGLMYLHSHNSSLNLLGQRYLAMAETIPEMMSLLPNAISTMHINSTVMVVQDLSAARIEASAELAALTASVALACSALVIPVLIAACYAVASGPIDAAIDNMLAACFPPPPPPPPPPTGPGCVPEPPTHACADPPSFFF